MFVIGVWFIWKDKSFFIEDVSAHESSSVMYFNSSIFINDITNQTKYSVWRPARFILKADKEINIISGLVINIDPPLFNITSMDTEALNIWLITIRNKLRKLSFWINGVMYSNDIGGRLSDVGYFVFNHSFFFDVAYTANNKTWAVNDSRLEINKPYMLPIYAIQQKSEYSYDNSSYCQNRIRPFRLQNPDCVLFHQFIIAIFGMLIGGYFIGAGGDRLGWYVGRATNRLLGGFFFIIGIILIAHAPFGLMYGFDIYSIFRLL